MLVIALFIQGVRTKIFLDFRDFRTIGSLIFINYTRWRFETVIGRIQVRFHRLQQADVCPKEASLARVIVLVNISVIKNRYENEISALRIIKSDKENCYKVSTHPLVASTE